MRPIKFRAFNMKTKELLNNVSIYSLTDHTPPFSATPEGLMLRPDNPDWVIMQFTGLHDRHGTEIYEGDILKHNGVVSYEEGSGGGLDEGARWIGFAMDEYHIFKEDEILGNIYEHPDLLKESR